MHLKIGCIFYFKKLWRCEEIEPIKYWCEQYIKQLNR